VIPTAREVGEKSDNNKSKNIEKAFFKLGPSATNVKIMGMLLTTVQTYLRLPSLKVFIEAPKPDSTISSKSLL